ncbi:hypothetical protein AX774_g767 [Zancudomyces culisetae]|uniref:Uncharacterized protein n=1 Tax=Zancudomyces culisetae TaxID=1213189 RepID=A0A1R1PXQ4_ZANCU|nr:hypothetical protein AX774_g767 [Zancudomyces culisetae]|eukprot:OMH85688.1 hypothetical protein AX774_g767 [Zancudomyces culisetae]
MVLLATLVTGDEYGPDKTQSKGEVKSVHNNAGSHISKNIEDSKYNPLKGKNCMEILAGNNAGKGYSNKNRKYICKEKSDKRMKSQNYKCYTLLTNSYTDLTCPDLSTCIVDRKYLVCNPVKSSQKRDDTYLNQYNGVYPAYSKRFTKDLKLNNTDLLNDYGWLDVWGNSTNSRKQYTKELINQDMKDFSNYTNDYVDLSQNNRAIEVGNIPPDVDIQGYVSTVTVKETVTIEENCSDSDVYPDETTVVIESDCDDSGVYPTETTVVIESDCDDSGVYPTETTVVIESDCDDSGVYPTETTVVLETDCDDSGVYPTETTITVETNCSDSEIYPTGTTVVIETDCDFLQLNSNVETKTVEIDCYNQNGNLMVDTGVFEGYVYRAVSYADMQRNFTGGIEGGGSLLAPLRDNTVDITTNMKNDSGNVVSSNGGNTTESENASSKRYREVKLVLAPISFHNAE